MCVVNSDHTTAVDCQQRNAQRSILKKLPRKQRRFIREYLIDFNGSKACLRAGYASKRPDALAYTLLRNDGIHDAVEQLMELEGITEERIQQTLASMVHGDGITDEMVDKDGNVTIQRHRLAAIRELNRLKGFVSDGKGGANVQVNVMFQQNLAPGRKGAEDIVKIAASKRAAIE